MSVEKVIGGLGLQAIKDWASARFMPRSPYVIVRLKFGAEFVGQTWELRNQDRSSEVYTGTVDSSRAVDVAVLETSATYVLTVDAIQDAGGETVTRYIHTNKYFGIYPRMIKYVELVQWPSGTDAQIGAMLAASKAGWLDLYEEAGWRVGDARGVSLAASGGVSRSNPAQSATLILVNHGGYYDTDGNEVGFIWQQLNVLSEYDGMNTTNTNSGGWDACQKRTWCNGGYRNALPEYIRNGLRKVGVATSTGQGVSVPTTSEDWCFLPAEKEVFGSNSQANATAEASLSQWEWYKTAENRVKRTYIGSTNAWWLRSIRNASTTDFCDVTSSGNPDASAANTNLRVAPCGCF